MTNLDEIRALIYDLESDRIERTISTTNTDKFGQAICAFANDLPNHAQAGYLFLGVKDNGELSGIKVTDDLLKNVAAIRTDGNIQPQPSMTVEKVSLDDGKEMVMVKVEPSAFPPVRYKGRIWVRIGPRKGVANEDDERILMEKRRVNVISFDASPCLNASMEDLDLSLFKHYFLPKSMSDDALEDDRRDVKYQLASYGFYDIRYNCPTNAGMLFFAKHLRRFIPGAYIQYVRYAGNDRSGDILTEHEFKENLCTILPELDTFIKTTIANRRPIPVSALREEMVADYPDWATRELVMNAICHRDYTSNGPIQFYQYDDRIEIMNHGGLYGRVNKANFPNVNDYRNIVVAEAMKVLGFVNRQSRGVLKLQKDLKANGNGEAVYDFGYQTVVMVIENKSPRGEQLMAEAIAKGLLVQDEEKPSEKWSYLTEKGEKPSEMKENHDLYEGKSPEMKENYDLHEGKSPEMKENYDLHEGKSSEMKENYDLHEGKLDDFPSPMVKNVYEALKMNRKAKYSWLQDNLGISESTLVRAINDLKRLGYIDSEHSKVNGEWQLLK